MSHTIIDSEPNATGHQFGIVISRYNDYMTRQLLDGALECLARHGAQEEHITIVWVPGSDETPLVAEKLARTRQLSAIITIGVVIEGETRHAEVMLRHCAEAFSRISSQYDLPVINGIVSARTTAQAVTRAETRGEHFAAAAIHMAQVFKTLSSTSASTES